MTLFACTVDSPVGELFVTVDEDGAIRHCGTIGGRSRFELESRIEDDVVWTESACAGVATELREYFDGARDRFTAVCAPRGTAFQREVWSELQRIPYGTTISYQELARRIGNPKAVRAAGRANATNPIAIIIPCHRVIGADGSLTGYAGGLEMKRALLALESGKSL